MRKGLRQFIFLCLVLSVLFVVGSHVFLSWSVSSGKFKSFAENHLRSLLQTDVRIGEVDTPWMGRIRLSQVEIKLTDDEKPSWIEIEEILFSYNLFHLVSDSIRLPTTIQLSTSMLNLNHEDVMKKIKATKKNGFSGPLISKIRMKGARISYYFPSFDRAIELDDITFEAKADVKGVLQLSLTGRSHGFIEGPVHVKGYWNPDEGDHSFELSLNHVELSSDLPVQFKAIQGSLFLKDKVLTFNSLKAVSNGWDFQFEGKVSEFDSLPQIQTNFKIGKEDDSLADIHLNLDFRENNFDGHVRIATSEDIPFSGEMIRQERQLLLQAMRFGKDYEGQGEFNFTSGDYSFGFRNELQRFLLKSNLSEDELKLELDLNHFDLFGLDLVTSATINFWPLETRAVDEPWKLRGRLATNYFILEQQPFHDFEGSFLMGPRGIEDLRTHWGNAFEMIGDIILRKQNAEVYLTLRTSNFDLSQVKELAAKPLPKDLEGVLNGKIKIEGAISKPEIIGSFAVKEGKIGKLDFDRMLIQFRGFSPYLAVNDSKIVKGRTNLYLTGAFDLSLQNIFHGIKIETSDRVIIWKGISLTSSGSAHGIDLEMSLPGFSKLAFDFQSNDNLSQMGSQDALQDESYVSIQPKVKF